MTEEEAARILSAHTGGYQFDDVRLGQIIAAMQKAFDNGYDHAEYVVARKVKREITKLLEGV